MTSDRYPREILEKLDGWANQLAEPLLPPRVVLEGNLIRLLFREHIPHAVMVGKTIRAVSGLRAALQLAEAGYITECESLLRMVSDFCLEVTAIGEALHRGAEIPVAVKTFVDQYFTFKHRTPEALAAAERTRYVAREELMKAEGRLAEAAKLDPNKLRDIKRFLNMAYDSYVHGAYESTMELCDPNVGDFMMRGHRAAGKREEFVDAVFQKMHEVVTALELTAALTAHEAVFNAARETRRAMIPASRGSTHPRREYGSPTGSPPCLHSAESGLRNESFGTRQDGRQCRWSTREGTRTRGRGR